MIVNRIGDVGLALALCAIFLTFKTLDYNITFSLLPCVVTLNLVFCHLISIESALSHFCYFEEL